LTCQGAAEEWGPTPAEPRHLQTLAHVRRSEESTGDQKLVPAAFNAGYVALVSRPGKLKVESGKMQSYVEERDGGYYIADTRISLDSIVHAFQAGESPEGILRSFPLAGPLVRIYGAITFYLENKEKVEGT
jgi:uncharacterized protein (DUF433 family)